MKLEDARVEVTPSGDRLAPGDPQAYQAMEEAARRLAEAEPPVVIVGPTDSGKSTLAAWAAGLAAQRGAPGSAWLLEADVGQNEVYAPAFEALVEVEPPFIPGWAKAEPLRCFTGAYTPSRALHKYLSCARRLARRAGGYLVVDTDGWVAPWDGLYSKAALAEAVDARTIAAVALPDAHARALQALKPDAALVRLPRLTPRAKSGGDRRAHRERLVTLQLLQAKPRPVNLRETPAAGLPVAAGTPLDAAGLQLPGIPQHTILYAEAQGDSIVVVSRARARPPPGVRLLRPGWERGLLAALHDPSGQQHIAVIERINYKTLVATVLTPHQGPITLLEAGQVTVTPPQTQR